MAKSINLLTEDTSVSNEDKFVFSDLSDGRDKSIKAENLFGALGGATVDYVDDKASLLRMGNSRAAEIVGSRARKAEPVFTFIDDDGRVEAYDNLLPIFSQRNVPCSIALFGSRHFPDNTSANLSIAQIKELHDDYGWEVLCHGYTHTPALSLTPEEFRDELQLNRDTFKEIGIDLESHVYVGGQNDQSVRNITREIYRAAYGASGDENEYPLQTYRINRFELGAFEGTRKTLSEWEDIIDTAIEEKQWIIFMLHVGSNLHQPADDQMIADIIDYIQSVDADIVRCDEALDRVGNVIDYGDYEDDEYFQLGCNGQVRSNNIIEESLFRAGNNTFTPSNIPTDFPEGKITIQRCVSSDWPESNGMLLTYAVTGGIGDYVWQEYYARNSSRKYMRGSTSSGDDWQGWKEHFGRLEFSAELSFGTVAAHSTKDVNLSVGSYPALADSEARDVVIASPFWRDAENNQVLLASGIIHSAFAYGNQQIRIRVANVTDEPITMPDREWFIQILKRT